MSAVEELYLRNGSRPFCRCAMSYNCFRPFICHATSDNKATRETRKVTNKMAAHCVPSKKLTIDEQLYSFRGYILGQIIMLCKPAKYVAEVVNNAKLDYRTPLLNSGHSHLYNLTETFLWTVILLLTPLYNIYLSVVQSMQIAATYHNVCGIQEDVMFTQLWLFMSTTKNTCHTTLKIDNHRDDRRPNITNDYNLGKGGMGSMDYKKRRFFLQTKDQ
ncbi:hypothetical protein T01_2348 [Trichinella spiralis]|uniref:PiggyBac transposable element-derived protein domain-containing protein n=1 Tax=Trichinella spiralis TaxID=6334 RepID=A0A0V1AQZ7_TRISP|nr:hypothetical protein T01_2348 [Trichinella spiralis]